MLPIVDGKGLSCAWIPGRFGFPAHSLTLVAKGTFDLHHDGVATPAEEPEDPSGDVPYDDAPEGAPRYESDFAWHKPRADLLLVGACHPPGGATARCDVGFRVGGTAKQLRVVGDRRWLLPFGPFSPKSAPRPFERMELRYENAAGGGRSKRNPLGKGRARTRDEAGRIVRAVPNLQAPDRGLPSPWWQGEPAGLGPLARTWRPRTRRLGTYRRKWRRTRWPWFPDDFDWAHFNAAPPDQRAPYLQGDEPVELRNLHPEHPVYRSRLPGWRMRCFLDVPGPEGESPALVEVPLSLDTLWIDAEAERLILVWRGIAEVASPEHEEVAHVFFAPEPMDDPPADAEAVARRFAQARAAALGEEPEAPEGETPEQAIAAAKQAQAAQVDALMSEFQDALEAAGLPRDYMDRPSPPFEERVAASLERARSLLGPEDLADASFPTVEELRAQEAAALAFVGYEVRETPVPERLTREGVEQRAAAGESLAGEDLRELDLSGLALAGADLTEADLEGAVLRECDLAGARLDGARLGAADLSGAGLAGAALAAADLTGARLAGADLSDAVLDEATLDGADLGGGVLARVSARGATFVEADLRRANLEAAVLESADLSDARLDDARLAGATLVDATLEGAGGERLVFDAADLTRLRAGSGCRFPGASFERVRGADSTWEGAALAGARFGESDLERADFSGADLSEADLARCQMPGARFERATLVGARLDRTNLFRGSVERADLSEADLSGANLYEVETLDARLRGTGLRGANLRMSKLA